MSFKILLPIGVAAMLSGCGQRQAASANPATLEELNRDLSVIMLHDGGRLPDTNEICRFLAASGKGFPTPPPGKQIVLDPAARQFVITSR